MAFAFERNIGFVRFNSFHLRLLKCTFHFDLTRCCWLLSTSSRPRDCHQPYLRTSSHENFSSLMASDLSCYLYLRWIDFGLHLLIFQIGNRIWLVIFSNYCVSCPSQCFCYCECLHPNQICFRCCSLLSFCPCRSDPNFELSNNFCGCPDRQPKPNLRKFRYQFRSPTTR